VSSTLFFREPVERSPLSDALAEALNQRLIAIHGSTMSLPDIAAELGITVGALRIRQSRFSDLPAPIPHLRTHRWPTPRIATWLCAFGEHQSTNAMASGRPPGSPRPRGRPRKITCLSRPRAEADHGSPIRDKFQIVSLKAQGKEGT